MTEDEIRVLGFVDFGLGGPASVLEHLRPVFRSLIERGLIKETQAYFLSETGKAALKTAQDKP